MKRTGIFILLMLASSAALDVRETGARAVIVDGSNRVRKGGR